MRQIAIAALSVFVCSGPALAVDLTLQRTSSVASAPVGDVDRQEIAPPPGISQAPTKARPDYNVEGRSVGPSARGRVPVPQLNAAAVSYCEVETVY